MKMVRNRVNKIKKESSTDDENSSVKIKQEIKEEVLEDMEDNKNDLKSIKEELKSKKTSKVNNLRYFNKSDKLKKRDASKKERGVVYVRCLPHGFYEKQLEGYFGQFGKVTGVYVPKSRKTGRAKGYGFVEFLHPEVAEIAADTMNNYLMFNRLIKTEVVPPEKQRPVMFSDKYKSMKAQRSHSKLSEKAAERHKLICTRSENFARKAATKVRQFHQSLKNLGIDYKFKVVGEMEPVKLTGIKAIDPDKSPQGKTSSPLIKSPAKKKTNKIKKMKGPLVDPQSSSGKVNKANKLKIVRKRLNKVTKIKGPLVPESSSSQVNKVSKLQKVGKRLNKVTKIKGPLVDPESSSSQVNKVSKLKKVGKRLSKTKKESNISDKSSSVKVKQEINNKNLSSEESPKKKKKIIKNKQIKKPPTEPQSDNQDNKVSKFKMVRKRANNIKKGCNVDDKSSPVEVKQEIKVKSINKKKNKDIEDNKNNLKCLKKDFKAKKTPKINNLRSLSGKLKSKVASKKLA